MYNMTISEKKLAANKITSKIANQAWIDQCDTRYENNPTFCKQCGDKLPRKKKNNKFCSSSCAATFNNTGREKVPRYKCLYCDTMIKQGKYCSNSCSSKSKVKYFTEEEREAVRKRRNCEVSANYRAKVKNQTPPDADRKAIREFYNNCPEGYEVDRIIPISKGGLHTLSNLQYLTITENRRKSNKII